MSSTNFINGTVVQPSWLNDVNTAVYGTIKNAKLLGATGNGTTNDSVAVQTLLTANNTIYLPAGTYLLNNLDLPAGGNVKIIGDGPDTILLQAQINAGDSKGIFSAQSQDPTQISNLIFQDLKFLGNVTGSGFSQFTHLLSINGTNNVTIDRCQFVGFQGDGVYIGSGYTGGLTCHNTNVRITNCLFDGVNNSNRNGISVIDGVGIYTQNNKFINITSSTMPGAIDIEPDSSVNIIKNIYIQDNRFENIGGNVGVVSIQIGSSIVLPTNIKIQNNQFINSVVTAAHAEIDINMNRTVTATDLNQGIEISGNYGYNGYIPFRLFSGKGFNVHDNVWDTYLSGGLFSYISGSTNLIQDINITNNEFVRLATLGGPGVSAFSINYGNIINNKFTDCGGGTSGSYALDFDNGTSSYITIDYNQFTAPTGKTLFAIQKESAHTFTPATNIFGLNNIFNGVQGSNFQTLVTTIASGATISLPYGPLSCVFVSGTTTITSIPVSQAYVGKTITLIFQGILTVTDGSNLKLAGNFVTTADDTLTLTTDGTNWYEVARSVN